MGTEGEGVGDATKVGLTSSWSWALRSAICPVNVQMFRLDVSHDHLGHQRGDLEALSHALADHRAGDVELIGGDGHGVEARRDLELLPGRVSTAIRTSPRSSSDRSQLPSVLDRSEPTMTQGRRRPSVASSSCTVSIV